MWYDRASWLEIRSGKVLVSSASSTASGAEEKLLGTNTQKVSADLVKYVKLRFELRRSEPTQSRRSSMPVDSSEFFAPRKMPVRVSSISPAVQKGLSERLEMLPKSVADLRDFGVSRRVLERLVRKKLMVEIWGSKGVGLLYEITQEGLEDLQKLRELSSMGTAWPKGLAHSEEQSPWLTLGPLGFLKD